jgi:hypothetical protein
MMKRHFQISSITLLVWFGIMEKVMSADEVGTGAKRTDHVLKG